MKKKYKIKSKILVAGMYPAEKEYSINEFTLKRNIVNKEYLNKYMENELIYVSPLIGFCCYNDTYDNVAYLTFEKEKIIELEVNEDNIRESIEKQIENLNLSEEIIDLQKYLTLNINNSIMFPIAKEEIYDLDNTYITCNINISKLNVPSLISYDISSVKNKIEKQNQRLNAGFSYKKIMDLKQNNKLFDRALSLFYSSLAVNDDKVGFILLVSSLETLLNLSTYSKINKCERCSQDIYKISTTISENVNCILMDNTEETKKFIKACYSKRSKYLHGQNVEISNCDYQKLQEIVRKVLLMYWYISISIVENSHKLIIKEFQSEDYSNKALFISFLPFLDNSSFSDKLQKILLQFGQKVDLILKLL